MDIIPCGHHETTIHTCNLSGYKPCSRVATDLVQFERNFTTQNYYCCWPQQTSLAFDGFIETTNKSPTILLQTTSQSRLESNSMRLQDGNLYHTTSIHSSFGASQIYNHNIDKQYISKRNERERSRVRNVNDAFENLKSILPFGIDRLNKRMSKVEILRAAIDYIKSLENLLAHHPISPK